MVAQAAQGASPAPAAAPPVAQTAPHGAPAVRPRSRTIMGGPAAFAASQGSAGAAPARGGNFKRTVMGVAPAVGGAQAQRAGQSSLKRTLMGVLAPFTGQPAETMEYVEEEYEEIVTEEGKVEQRVRRIPVQVPPLHRRPWFVLLVAAGALGLGALLLALLVRTPAQVQVIPKLDETGKDILHVVCSNCAEGTKVAAGASAAPLDSALAADVPLPAPLHVGENQITLSIQRPSSSKQETLHIPVPLLFRVQPELSGLSADPPVLHVLVELAPGGTATLDGKPVTLSPQGTAKVDFPLGDIGKGPSFEAKSFEKTIPYSITPAGGTEQKGALHLANIPIVPLVIDSLGDSTLVDSSSVIVAGRSIVGAAVSIEGHPLTVAPDGTFSVPIDVSDLGIHTFTVRATYTNRIPRWVTVSLRHVANLSEEAKAYLRDGVKTYDPNLSTGKLVAWTMDVMSAVITNHQTLAILQMHSGCKEAHCVARVVIPGGPTLTPGSTIRVFGHSTGVVTSSAGSIPGVEADFILAP